MIAGTLFPQNRLTEKAHDDKIGKQKPVAHQEKNCAKKRHIDQCHKPLSDPADHEHVDRRTEKSGNSYGQHHAYKIVDHTNHIHKKLYHNQHRRKQYRRNDIFDRPFLYFFHKLLHIL